MTAHKDLKIGGLLLAAGGSSRFGSPKQLLKFEGTTLLRRAAEAIIGSQCEPVVVVLGAHAKQLRTEIADLRACIYLNADWRSGMSSSIRSGLGHLLTIEPDLAAVLITLCDQPLITSDMLKLFVEKFCRTQPAIVAAAYDGILGIPALFSQGLFAELSNLEGDKGARDLIRSAKNVQRIDVPDAAFDIDEPEDVERIYRDSSVLRRK